MDALLGNNTPFVVAAYLTSAVILLALLAWLIASGRAHARDLARLEAAGVRRRGDGRDAAP